MLQDLFPLQNSWLLITSLILAITATFLSQYNKDKPALVGLFFAAIFLRLFMAHLDPFLNNWDERFHALVARNMMDHPFTPMMHVNNIFPYDYTAWCCNHIWLHKQPLFMWQMALSMKIFGVSAFAIRYPAVLMGALMVLMVNRITTLITSNKKIAFMAALLMCFSYFNLQLISGNMGMDQNDACFGFYILASIWAYAEYRNKQTLQWVLLIGLFAGCAILTKWLTGLLVFSGWGLNILFTIRDKKSRKEILHFILALIVCTVVFLPWQLYILHTFPMEAKYEFEYNSRHVWEVMESFSGDIWYYWDRFPIYFGYFIWFLVVAGLIMFLLIKKYHHKLTAAVVTCFLITYSFFSFIAQTKIGSYFNIAIPLGYIFMAVATYHILGMTIQTKSIVTDDVSIGHLALNFHNTIKKRFAKFLYIPVAITITIIVFNIPEITATHDPKNLGINSNFWRYQAHNDEVYRNLKKYIPANTKVVFNMLSFNEVDVMFYNKGIEACAWVPREDDFNKYIKAKNIPIAVFKAHKEYTIPDYIKDYPLTYIIDKEIQ